MNAAVLGSDAKPGDPEFDLFIKEVAREMTVKAGQKCTAIRRVIVPRSNVQAVQETLCERLGRTVVGDPRKEQVTMGPLSSLGQVEEVGDRIADLGAEAELVLDGAAGRRRRSKIRARFFLRVFYIATAPFRRKPCIL